MAKPYSLLIFDWDGTLFDSTATIAYALQQAFVDAQLVTPSRAACQQIIGLGMQEAFYSLAPHASHADYLRVLDAYRQRYAQKDSHLTLFDGVLTGLESLKKAGYTLAVATGKSRAGLNQVLAHSGMDVLFQCTRTADETRSKPHPLMVEEILMATATEAKQAILLGDTTHDMGLAQNAGIAACAMSYGAHSADELKSYNPKAIFSHFSDFVTWLHT